MASSKGNYSESEILMLNNYYERGLRSKTKHKTLLEEAIQSTGLQGERIMVLVYTSLAHFKMLPIIFS